MIHYPRLWLYAIKACSKILWYTSPSNLIFQIFSLPVFQTTESSSSLIIRCQFYHDNSIILNAITYIIVEIQFEISIPRINSNIPAVGGNSCCQWPLGSCLQRQTAEFSRKSVSFYRDNSDVFNSRFKTEYPVSRKAVFRRRQDRRLADEGSHSMFTQCQHPCLSSSPWISYSPHHDAQYSLLDLVVGLRSTPSFQCFKLISDAYLTQ